MDPVVAHRVLAEKWGDEYCCLSCLARDVLVEDYRSANVVDRDEYVRNIGRGKLKGYSDLMISTFAFDQVRLRRATDAAL